MSKIVLYTNENYNTYEYVPINSEESDEYNEMVQYVNDLNLKLEEYVKTKHTKVESFPCRKNKTLESIDEYKEFNHVYVMYFVAGKVFTVHYEIESSKRNSYVLYLKIDSLETLKYDESNDTFVVVSKVIINPDLKPAGTYRFNENTYSFDLQFNTGFGYFSKVNYSSDYSSCNQYYNNGDWSEYNNVSLYFRFSSAVLAKDN